MGVFRPGKPAARFIPSGSQSLTPASVGTPVALVPDFMDEGSWLGTTWEVSRSGLYMLNGSVGKGAAASASTALAGWARNGTDVLLNGGASTTAGTSFGFSDLAQLDDGDLVGLVVKLSGGSSQTVTVVGTSFSVVRIGPVRWT